MTEIFQDHVDSPIGWMILLAREGVLLLLEFEEAGDRVARELKARYRGSVLGFQGAVVRLSPGPNPPATALAEVFELPMDATGKPVSGYSPRGMDIDSEGNAVAFTTSVESAFGSRIMVRGFLLNNQLTDFSFDPVDSAGAAIANKVGPNKRPRSSMAPTIVFSKAADGSKGDFLMATGSPGGATIIQFVTKTLIGVIDWKLDAQQATSMVNFGAANSPTTGVGGEHPYIDSSNSGLNDPLLNGLRTLGHTVSFAAQSSGVSTIVKTMSPSRGSSIYVGGADPRREGIALGDSPI